MEKTAVLQIFEWQCNRQPDSLALIKPDGILLLACIDAAPSYVHWTQQEQLGLHASSQHIATCHMYQPSAGGDAQATPR